MQSEINEPDDYRSFVSRIHVTRIHGENVFFLEFIPRVNRAAYVRRQAELFMRNDKDHLSRLDSERFGDGFLIIEFDQTDILCVGILPKPSAHSEVVACSLNGNFAILIAGKAADQMLYSQLLL